MIHMEKVYAELTKEDLDKLGQEIGERFGHSSLHSMAFDMMRERLQDADRELQAAGYCYDHPALRRYRPASSADQKP